MNTGDLLLLVDNKYKLKNIRIIYKNKDEVIHDLVDGKYFILDTYYDNSCKNELKNIINDSK